MDEWIDVSDQDSKQDQAKAVLAWQGGAGEEVKDG